MKPTLGSEVVKILDKEHESRSVVELEREMQRNYMKELIDCVKKNESKFEDDFFIVVLTKNERIFKDRVIRNIFFPRYSCPTPNYDQSVFRFIKKTADLEYIWTIPSQDACYYLLDNKDKVVKNERELLQFVVDYADGTLMRRCLELNKEGDYGTRT